MKRNFTVNGKKYKVADTFNPGLKLDHKYDVYYFSTHYDAWTKCGTAKTLVGARELAEERECAETDFEARKAAL